MGFKLQANEHIILMARRHWFRPVLETLALLFSLLIPLLFSSVFTTLLSDVIELGNVTILSIILMLSWAFIVWNIAFVIWTNHWLDVVVVTNMHVIDIEQIGLWSRNVSTLTLEKIQDVSSETSGIVSSILNYGDLEIQTAGSLTNFVIKKIERPDLVRQKIVEVCNKQFASMSHIGSM